MPSVCLFGCLPYNYEAHLHSLFFSVIHPFFAKHDSGGSSFTSIRFANYTKRMKACFT